MSRIKLEDSIMDALVKMSDGNPGALTAMQNMLMQGENIDPQGALGGTGAILDLDTWEIYGSDIYILWNDKCNRDVRRMLMIIRATQLGNFSHEKLKAMAADQRREINLTDDEWEEQDKFVCEFLPEFKKE